jgi:phosphatidylserine decarboxylase
METALLIAAAAVAAGLLALAAAWLFWRYWWFWRNPPRNVPRGDHVLSPADGTVVYVKRAAPNEPIIACKQGKAASINDIVREDVEQPKILIGIFMSPFSVHYNRTPIAATLVYKKQYPAEGKNLHMGSMHWRTILHRMPIYAHSAHIVQNNRAVSRWLGQLHGQDVSCYLVQIGGGSVHGIDINPDVGQRLEQGEIFGMIRVGSQVDLLVPDLPGLSIKVEPGDRVVAGETVLIE